MKFRAPGTESVPLGLTSGHTAVVTPEGNELEEMFHREAIAQGCFPDTGEFKSPGASKPTFDRALVIGEAMVKMRDGKEEGDFTGDGKPNLNRLSAIVGFKVNREEADTIWAEIVADEGGEG